MGSIVPLRSIRSIMSISDIPALDLMDEMDIAPRTPPPAQANSPFLIPNS